MHWFSQYYQNSIASEGWLTHLSPDTAIFVLLFSIIMGSSLFFKKEIKPSLFILSWIISYAAMKWINPIFSLEFINTGSRLDSLSLETLIVSFGMLIGPILLFINVKRRFRSLDRMMIGLLITVCSWLIFGYHIAIINGSMKYELKQRESDLTAVIKLSDSSFKETCRTMSLDCRQGKKIQNLSHLVPEIEKQANDYLNFYRNEGKSPLFFSDSNALITQQSPYAYAYIETATKYRWVIDTKKPKETFKSHKVIFSIFTMTAVFFWTAFIYTAMFLHHLMRYLREAKMARK